MHRLTSITIGVPNVQETAEYYRDFGLIPAKEEMVSAYSAEALVSAREHRFSTVDGGEQLRIVHSPRRRLMQVGIGVEDSDDLGVIASRLQRLDLAVKQDEASLLAEDPGSEVAVMVEIAPKLEQERRRGRSRTGLVGSTGCRSGRRGCCASRGCVRASSVMW